MQQSDLPRRPPEAHPTKLEPEARRLGQGHRRRLCRHGLNAACHHDPSCGQPLSRAVSATTAALDSPINGRFRPDGSPLRLLSMATATFLVFRPYRMDLGDHPCTY